jgi:hypothetical protein
MNQEQEYELTHIVRRMSKLMKNIDRFHEGVIQELDHIATRLDIVVQLSENKKSGDYVK